MKFKKGFSILVVGSGVLLGGGYKIPEQSLNSMALGAAYIAHTMGPDTAYFNPAGMSFMGERSYVEGGLTLAHLPSISYTLAPPYSGESKKENIILPYAHYVGKPIGDIRWGISLVVPGGLSKRWDTPYQKAYAQEFSLENIELNPSVAYKISDDFSVGGGLRMVYSKGVVRSDGTDIGLPASRNLEGDTIAFGYNLALLYKPTSDINLAATYRSKVSLNEKGDSYLGFMGDVEKYIGRVTIPLPATLVTGVSKTWNDVFTLEANYERNYWSAYKNLDFDYDRPINRALISSFDDPQVKNWKDTNTFRLGATLEMDNDITWMMGFTLDQTPVNKQHINFELPDSDAKIYSTGFRHKASENLSWGMAFLYTDKKTIKLNPGDVLDHAVLSNGGTFKKGGAFLSTIGVAYEY